MNWNDIEAVIREAEAGLSCGNADIAFKLLEALKESLPYSMNQPTRAVGSTKVNVGDYVALIVAQDDENGEIFEQHVVFPFASKTSRVHVYVDRHIGRPI